MTKEKGHRRKTADSSSVFFSPEKSSFPKLLSYFYTFWGFIFDSFQKVTKVKSAKGRYTVRHTKVIKKTLQNRLPDCSTTCQNELLFEFRWICSSIGV